MLFISLFYNEAAMFGHNNLKLVVIHVVSLKISCFFSGKCWSTILSSLKTSFYKVSSGFAGWSKREQKITAGKALRISVKLLMKAYLEPFLCLNASSDLTWHSRWSKISMSFGWSRINDHGASTKVLCKFRNYNKQLVIT